MFGDPTRAASIDDLACLIQRRVKAGLDPAKELAVSESGGGCPKRFDCSWFYDWIASTVTCHCGGEEENILQPKETF